MGLIQRDAIQDFLYSLLTKIHHILRSEVDFLRVLLHLIFSIMTVDLNSKILELIGKIVVQ